MSESIKLPEAFRLADTPFALRDGRWNFDADDELRRLHNENQAAHAVGIQQEREMMVLEAEVERLRANRDFWHQACLQAQEHRDGANASNAVWEAETVKLRAEAERLREVTGKALEALENTTPTGFNMERDKQFFAAIDEIRAALKETK